MRPTMYCTDIAAADTEGQEQSILFRDHCRIFVFPALMMARLSVEAQTIIIRMVAQP